MLVERQQQSGTMGLPIAIILPLALLAVAYALWAISDRLLYIGPFDRAAFGWIVVLPVWWLAPGIAGLAWSGMPNGRRRIAAIVVGAIVAVVAGVLLANGIDQIGCTPVTSWTDDLPISLALGVVIGVGPAIGALLAASAADRTTGLWRPVAAVATGAGIGLVGFLASLMTFAFFFPPVFCAPVPS